MLGILDPLGITMLLLYHILYHMLDHTIEYTLARQALTLARQALVWLRVQSSRRVPKAWSTSC